MALSPNSTLVHPIQVNLTAGSDSNVAILIGAGSPTGNTDPWNSAAKGTLHLRIDATDDYPALYQKVDSDGANDDWVMTITDKIQADWSSIAHLTMDTDKKIYLRGTDNFMHSSAGSKINITAPSGVDISRMTIGAGTYVSSMLAGSGTAVFGSLAASAASTASLTLTGLTQNHKCMFSPSGFSGCLQLTNFSCSPGGGVLTIGVVNAASEAYAGGTNTFSYLAVTDVA